MSFSIGISIRLSAVLSLLYFLLCGTLVDFQRDTQWPRIDAHTYYRICSVSWIIPDFMNEGAHSVPYSFAAIPSCFFCLPLRSLCRFSFQGQLNCNFFFITVLNRKTHRFYTNSREVKHNIVEVKEKKEQTFLETLEKFSKREEMIFKFNVGHYLL